MARGAVYAAGETPRAPGHRARCKLLVAVKDVIFGRRPCGRLLPSTTRRSARRPSFLLVVA